MRLSAPPPSMIILKPGLHWLRFSVSWRKMNSGRVVCWVRRFRRIAGSSLRATALVSYGTLCRPRVANTACGRYALRHVAVTLLMLLARASGSHESDANLVGPSPEQVPIPDLDGV